MFTLLLSHRTLRRLLSWMLVIAVVGLNVAVASADDSEARENAVNGEVEFLAGQRAIGRQLDTVLPPGPALRR